MRLAQLRRFNRSHDQALAWSNNDRARLLAALVSLAEAWHLAGRPAGPRVLPTFSTWSKAVGGILDHARNPSPRHRDAT